MMITVVGQTKGGVGKSMLAVNLAVMHAKRGRKVIVIDADKQMTASKWLHLRKINAVEPDLEMVALQLTTTFGQSEFTNGVRSLSERFDEVVVDSGGQDSKELRLLCVLADLLVAPARPTQADLWGLNDLHELLEPISIHNPDLRSMVVLNMADPLNIHGSQEMALTAIRELERLEFSNSSITQRPTLNRAFEEGRGVFDLSDDVPAHQKAQAEFENLYNNLYGAEGIAV